MTPEDPGTARQAVQQKIQDDIKARQAYEEAVDATIEPYMSRVTEGLMRVQELLKLASDVSPWLEANDVFATVGRETAATDIVRASVVLTHAYLEDFLRTIANALLPTAAENVLNRLPLAGTGRREKFSLGELVRHRHKGVDDLLRESVSEHLDRQTYNNTTDIALLLEDLGFDVSKFESEFPAIQEMMLRRHQIVHRADRIKVPDSNATPPKLPPEMAKFFGDPAYTLQHIEARQVETWVLAAAHFMADLARALAVKVNPLEELVKKLNFPRSQK